MRVGNALGAGHSDAAKRAAKVAIGLIGKKPVDNYQNSSLKVGVMES